MKNKLPSTIATFVLMLFCQQANAASKPQLFCVQKNVRDIGFVHGGRLMVTHSTKHEDTIRDVATRRLLWKSRERVNFVSADGKLLVTQGLKGGETVWSFATKRPLWKTGGRMISFIPDSNQLVIEHTVPFKTAPTDRTFETRDARSGRLLRSFNPAETPLMKALPQSLKDQDDCNGLDFDDSTHELRLASRLFLWRWSARTGRLISIQRWKLPSGQATTILNGSFVRDGQRLLLFEQSQSSRPSRLWNTRTGRVIRELPSIFTKLHSLNFLSWCRVALATSYVEPLKPSFSAYRFWDGKKLWTTNTYLSFSANGRWAFLPTKSGLVVRDTYTGDKLATLAGPTNSNFTPSPDNKWLYEARDGKIYRWRLPNFSLRPVTH